MAPKSDPEVRVREIRRQTRHRYSAEEKIRIVLVGLKGEESVAELQEILGHSSIVTTQRYGRLGEAHVQAEASRIQGRLGTPHGTPALRNSG